MLIDAAVEAAKNACLRYLDDSPDSISAEKEAIVPVMQAMQKVLGAASLEMAVKGFALDVYQGYRDADNGLDLRQSVRISLTLEGKLVKEDSVTTKNGLHVLGRQSYFVDIGSVLDAGVPAKKMVLLMKKFLDDPNFSALARGAKN